MSQINFENLIVERPDLLNAFGSLAAWLEDRPNVRFIEVPRIARELNYVPAEELIQALQILVEHHLAYRQFQVKSPEGDLTGEEYYCYSDIPQTLQDRFARNTFDRDEGTVTAGFVIER